MRRVKSVKPRVYQDPATGQVLEEPEVAREDVLAALQDMEAVGHVAGGVLVVVWGRAPGQVDGEMVTNGVVLTWQDRANAKPKPEQVVQAAPEPLRPPPPDPAQIARDQALQAAAAEAVAQAAGDDDDPQAQLQAAVDAALPPVNPGEEPEEDDSTVREQLSAVQ